MGKKNIASASAANFAQLIELPGAACDPIVNPRWRGRYPANIIPLWRLRIMRRARLIQEAEEHAARLRIGVLVKIGHRDSENFGRVCRIVGSGEEIGTWVVEALGGKLLVEGGDDYPRAIVCASWLEPQ